MNQANSEMFAIEFNKLKQSNDNYLKERKQEQHLLHQDAINPHFCTNLQL
jgi:hypothetical protein